jgi:hypothetical protein
MRRLCRVLASGVALLALLQSAPLSVSAHVAPPTVAAVTIPTVGSGSVRVSLPDRRSPTAGATPIAECTFTWNTNAGMKKAAVEEVAATAPPPKGRIDAATVVVRSTTSTRTT